LAGWKLKKKFHQQVMHCSNGSSGPYSLTNKNCNATGEKYFGRLNADDDVNLLGETDYINVENP
jgi:hypothetical protein